MKNSLLKAQKISFLFKAPGRDLKARPSRKISALYCIIVLENNENTLKMISFDCFKNKLDG